MSAQHNQPGRVQIASSAKRINAFLIVMAIFVTILAGRAVQVQGIDAAANAQAAAEQLTRTQILRAERGDIVDRNGQVLARSMPAFMVIADPWSISTNGYDPASMSEKQKAKAKQAPEAIAGILMRYLGGSKDDYLPKLTRATHEDGSPNQYEVLKRRVSAALYQQMAAELKEGGWFGIYPVDDPVRYYPNTALASNVIGFTNFDGEGAAGLEYALDSQLKGIDGTSSYQTGLYGMIPLGSSTLIPAVNGTNYKLTLDADLQWLAEQQLRTAVEQAKAKTGTAIVMSVKTGEILALANAPSFDSNKPTEASDADLGNRAVTDAYEPGSVQKVLTTAALLDAGIITPDTRVVVPSRIASGGGYIRDDFTHESDFMTARGVLARSSNVGTVQLARLLSKEQLHGYLANFGFGAATGIELPGETPGMGLLPGADMADYTRDQIAFGQGMSVTALQEAAAVAGVVNGGVYNQPTILKAAYADDGTQLPLPPREPRRVISEQASRDLVSMMEAVIASPEIHGHEGRMIEGYRMAGKSGTAQKIGKYGAYNGGHTGTFVAVAPVEDPQILTYVVIDEPAGSIYGGVNAMPTARDLMQLALPRYGVKPSANIAPYELPLSYQP